MERTFAQRRVRTAIRKWENHAGSRRWRSGSASTLGEMDVDHIAEARQRLKEREETGSDNICWLEIASGAIKVPDTILPWAKERGFDGVV
jgi:hypothetical protein